MITEIVYKEQGNGTDSWTITEWSGDEIGQGDMIDRRLVYEDPTIPESVDWDDVDFSTCPPEKITILKALLGL